ncbi:MAG: Fic family protein, partial [Polyangiaceae bacterium]
MHTEPLGSRDGTTEALDTADGTTLVTHADISDHLDKGEPRGRAWVFAQSQRLPRGTTPTDADIFDLHRAMYHGLVDWAGQPRTDARGPGVEWVKAHEVRIELRKLADDVRAWVDALPLDPRLAKVAAVVADAHHRFQRIHPFRDTNGRTGRVLDLFFWWVTFGFFHESPRFSLNVEIVPTPEAKREY